VYVGGSDGYGGTDAMRFLPATRTVTVGTTVTWTFLSGPHTVVSGSGGTPDGLFSSGAPQSTGNFTHTFPTAGTYPYYCTVHGASMSGTVIVN
jgi:plastocyanin